MANVILSNQIEYYSVDITDFNYLLELIYNVRELNIVNRCDFIDYFAEEENYPFLF